jgi:hypothetical protein
MESVRSTGVFNCPRCGRSKPYNHKSVNRWFTLYFIPVIPMGSIGAYVQCGQCGGTFGESVLSYDPEAETRQLYLKLRGLLMLVAMADGTPADADEIRAIGDAYQEATQTPLPVGDIESDMRHASAGKIQLGPYARQLGPQLNYQGKALFMRAAFHVLCAKGPPRSDASAVIAEIAQAMKLTTEQVKQILG